MAKAVLCATSLLPCLAFSNPYLWIAPPIQSSYLISPDCQVAASVTDCGLTIVDLKTGLLKSAVEDEGIKAVVRFSPDGKLLAVAYNDNSIGIFDTINWTLRARLVGHFRTVNDCSFTSDNRYLVSGSSDNSGRIWDLQTGAEVALLNGNFSPVIDVDVAPNNQFCTTVSDTYTQVWEIPTGKRLYTINPTLAPLEVSADSRNVIVKKNGINVYSINPFNLKYSLTYDKYLSYDQASITEDGKYLATQDSTGIKVRNAENGEALVAIPEIRGPFQLSNDASKLFLKGGSVQWDTATSAMSTPWASLGDFIIASEFSPDNTEYVVSDRSGVLSRELFDGSVRSSLTYQNQAVYLESLSADTELVAHTIQISGQSGITYSIAVTNRRTGEILWTTPVKTPYCRFDFSNGVDILNVMEYENSGKASVAQFQAHSGSLLQTYALELPYDRMIARNGNGRVAIFNLSGPLAIIDTQGNRIDIQKDSNPIRTVTFIKGGTEIAFTQGTKLSKYSTSDGTPISSRTIISGDIHAISDDGTMTASTSIFSNDITFESADGQSASVPKIPRDPYILQFSSNAEYLGGCSTTTNGSIAPSSTFVVPNPLAFQTISGKVSVPGFEGDLSKVSLHFVLLSPAGSSVSEWEQVLSSTGEFTHSSPVLSSGAYTLSVAGMHWLRKAVMVSIASRRNITAELINGDIDKDNVITIFDYLILNESFDKSEEDADWDLAKNADLDGDGKITVFDFLILTENFDKVGD